MNGYAVELLNSESPMHAALRAHAERSCEDPLCAIVDLRIPRREMAFALRADAEVIARALNDRALHSGQTSL
jgi:hypothetical protein